MTHSMREILPREFTVTRLNQRPFTFLEGPVWDEKRQVLYFSDPLEETVLAMDQPGNFQVIRRDSGYVNGMCMSRDGNLAVCRMASGTVEELCPETGKRLGTIASGYAGKPFHATNDVIGDGRGGYYITDPFFTYGPKTQDREATYHCAADGTVRRVAVESRKPNGLALSPDKRTLYIDDTGSREVWRYSVEADGSLSGASVFCRLSPPEDPGALPAVQRYGEADGMKVDSCGNIYITTLTGIQVFNGQGRPLGLIPMPGRESAANCVFGGSDLRTLFITARTSLYQVSLRIPGLSSI